MKIITGRAKTGKTQYIYHEIKEEIDKGNDENLILLVPDLMTYETEYDIIERLNLQGIMNLEVLSFKRLVHKIMDELGEKNNTPGIDSLGKIMILKEIFEKNRDKLKIFQKATSHTGFLKQFNLLLQELKQNQISIEALKQGIESTDNMFLRDKLSDIALIYSQYSEYLKDSFLDEEDLYELVISKIGQSKYIKNSRIWIDGFESFNKQRLNMVKILNDNSKSMNITLNIDGEYLEDIQAFDDWEAFKTTWDTFKSIEEIMGEDLEVIKLYENRIQSEEIRTIEKNIFSIDLEKYNQDTDNIEIYSAMDPYVEVELAAQKIITLVRDHGYRWKDIRIAVGNLDNYMMDIKKAFLKFEIPYFADTKRDITNNPLSKYILSILDMFIWNFQYDDVFQYLKTGLSPLNTAQINTIENYALERGIQGSKWFQTIDIEFLEEIRQVFISDFQGKIEEFKNLNTISEITGFLLEFFRLHKIHSKVERQINRFRSQEEYEAESEYLQVWNSVMNILEQIITIGEDREITPVEYRKMVEAGLMEAKISIIPPTIDRVEIGDIDRIAVSKTKALFILGANEGSLDSIKSKGLLLDEEIDALSQYNIKIVNSSDFSYFKKKHMLYKVFTNPTQRLFVSYALGTTNGSPLEPSIYIDILNMLFPKLGSKTKTIEKNLYEDISNKGGSYDPLVENMNNYGKDNRVDDIWKAVYAWYKDNDSERYNLIKNAFNYQNDVAKIKEMYIEEIFGEEITTTVSKLEDYAECQFQYFVRNILRPDDRKIQKVESYDLGNIYHSALENFIDRVITGDKKINDLNEEDIKALVEKSLEEVFQEYRIKVTALNANNRNTYLEKKIERVVNRTAATIIKQLQRGEFIPKYTEFQIGIIDAEHKDIEKGKYIDALEIKVKDKKIKLRGIVDRVDMLEDESGDIYLNIIDYKSSPKDIDFTYAYEGIQVQLLVYLKAILDNGAKLFGKKPKVAGVFYYHVNDPVIKDKESNIEIEILKNLKLKGLVLKDKEILRKMDNEIKANSDIIPTGITGKDEFRKNSNVVTKEEFDAILNFVYSKIESLSGSILDGNFKINPYRKTGGKTPCEYCKYLSICQFDDVLGDEYRGIKALDRNKFLESIAKGVVN